VYVSLTRTKGPPGQPLDVATMAGEEMLPWLREIDGFDSLVMLSSEADQTTLVLTFWSDRDVAERHRAARTRLREGVTAAAEVTIEETAGYEVTFVDLGPQLGARQA
jgi:hypothetical protein